MGALEGIKVIDVGLLVQGPQAGLLLADLGADVIKVELPRLGDQARWIRFPDEHGKAPFYVACNRGKRSMTLDLRVDTGKEAFLKLVDTADVLISNFKPGTLDEWGLGFETLHERNPRLVYATGSVFGPNGPGADREGADLAAQAAGGLISTTGSDGMPLTPVGVTIADHTASQNMSNGILAALIARERTGKGQRVDVSLLGGQIYAQAAEYTNYFLGGGQHRANCGHPLIHAAYGITQTSDGWIALVGVTPPQRKAFYTAIDRLELLEDERFQPPYWTREVRAEFFAEVADTFTQKTTAEWCELFTQAGTRFAPVNDYAAAAENPLAWENGYFIEVEHPEWGTMPMVGTPIQLSDTPSTPGHIAPELGQHTEEILLELGYTWEDIALMS